MNANLNRLIACGLGLVVGVAAASAQPAPAPPRPQPDLGAPPVPEAGTKTDEKAGNDESLQHGGNERPWATNVPLSEQTAALADFRAGNAQLNDGLFKAAADKYRDALKHWDHPAIHYNLALALMNLDQPIEVAESLAKATQYGAAPLEKDKFEHAKEYLLLVEKQLAYIEVSCDKPGAHVSVDGKEVFVAPGKFTEQVRIGKHTFVAEKQGYTTRINAPYIGPAEKFRIELKLFTAEELTRYHRKWDATWVPWVVVGGGALVGIAGALVEWSARSSYRDFDSKVAQCNQDSGTNAGCDVNSPGLTSLRDSGDSKKLIGFVMYGVAGGAVITGLALAYINRRDPYQIRPEDLQSERLTVAPVVSPAMTGAMVSGHF